MRRGTLYGELDQLRGFGWLVATKRNAGRGPDLLYWSLSEEGFGRIEGEALPTRPALSVPTTPPPHIPRPKAKRGRKPKPRPELAASSSRSTAARVLAPSRGAPVPLRSRFAGEGKPHMGVQMLHPQRPPGPPVSAPHRDWCSTYCPSPSRAPARAGAADFLAKPSRGPF